MSDSTTPLKTQSPFQAVDDADRHDAPKTLEFHPIADIFPLMEGEELDDLVADIRANALIEPVFVHEEMILDGRNRCRACLAAGIEPIFRPFGGDDPIAFVISTNLRRRHLTAERKREIIAK